MAGGVGLKPKVRIVCPECEEPLRFTCFYQQGNTVNWVLSAASIKHLAEPHAPKPKLELVSTTSDVEHSLAA